MSNRFVAIAAPFGLAILITLFWQSLPELTTPLFDSARDHIMTNGLAETGARNQVCAIYLDYRLFDSLFETGILLITVAGIIFMAKKDEDVI